MSSRWPILRYFLATHLLFLSFCFGLVVVVIAAVVGVYAIFGTVDLSALDTFGPGWFWRWAALGYGAYLYFTLLPTFLVHGRTRGEYVREVSAYQVVATAVLAALTALAYVGEALIYRAAGWSETFQPGRLFESGTEFGLVFVTYWTGMLVWTLAGSLLGAAVYRFHGGGLLLVPVAVVLLLLNGLNFGRAEPLWIGPEVGVWGTLGLAAVSSAVAVTLIWSLARNVSVRLRTA
ncbi:hypothetical protein [Cryptosporangium sp. NPDC048952]|uniref:hypothetical protein n=1 Tax=Cryptosporangium sp. NPDC048952 TaxID=3363961 RepID=UPI00371C7824